MASRRDFLKGVSIGVLGIAVPVPVYLRAFVQDEDEEQERDVRKRRRSDGKLKLPPGQRLAKEWEVMNPGPKKVDADDWRIRIHGEVEKELSYTFQELKKLPMRTQKSDVHCVTRWTVWDIPFKGVPFSEIVERVKPTGRAKHVIFECGGVGYSSNVPFEHITKSGNVMVATHAFGKPLEKSHGFPVRALVPDRYFWKSAKWLTGIRFVEKDRKGYWERRGYSNVADPWKEQRYTEDD